jgi:hypothetical protein
MGGPSLWVAGDQGPDFLHGFLVSQFSCSAAGLAQETQVCEQQVFLDPISHMGFRKLSSVVLHLGKLRLLAYVFCYLWSSRS